ncbi:hypothetical protein [Paenibacillus crassostreae]|uniref:hypothetical protein n=1 Tax=Paenibacillus crassostreae TaxID=1763538 RepID=UPI000A401518|nr:hypothetical protein [Paenibacillus crassostreae]
MIILVGIICLIFMCSSIIILASIAISLHSTKKSSVGKKDPYSFLFEVYDE